MNNNNLSSKGKLIEILEHIKDMVIVTGSYATGKYKENSDLDFLVKMLPEDEIDCEARPIEETYTNRLIKYFEKQGYKWDSVFIDSFHVDDTYIPLEFSAFYSIDEYLFEVDILGVKMTASKSNHNSDKYHNGEKIR